MFNPTLDTRITINDVEFKFAPHPVVPTLVWGQEGRHAIVFKLTGSDGESYGLKVFRPVFRHPGLLEAAESLWGFSELPGMSVCKQVVLTEKAFPKLIDQYEDLNYAMMMPWIEGKTWFDYLQTRDRLTLDESRAIAESMAWVLYALELNQLSHCDLSSGNVIVDPKLDRVHLIDVEDLYSPWLYPPPYVPAGTPGYQHEESGASGQWGPHGDRFGGAVLMAEMLGWAHPEVRKNAFGESYFAPDELQANSKRYDVLCEALRIYDEGFAEVFVDVWQSKSLADCPPLKTWYDLLDALPRDPVTEWAPIDIELFEEEVPTPADVAVGTTQPLKVTPAAAATTTTPAQQTGRRGCLQQIGSGCRQVIGLFFVLLGLVVLGAFVLGSLFEPDAVPNLVCNAPGLAMIAPVGAIMMTSRKHNDVL